jgi:hypothetical protein
MKETLTVRFMEGNTLWPVTKVDADLGIVVDAEDDAWPRRCELALVPQSPGTIFWMKEFAHAHEWQYPEYHLKVEALGGNLKFSGVEADGLPPGNYQLRISVEDLPASNTPIDVTISKGTNTTVVVPVTTDHRPLLLRPIETIPQEIRDLLQASTLDGQPALEWLENPTRRLNRKVCLLNLMAKLRSIPFWDPAAVPLIKRVESVFFARTERIYVRVTPGFLEDIQSFVDAEQHFYKEGRPTASVHQDLYAMLNLDTTHYTPISFREAGRRSMQAVVAQPDSSGGAYYADLDIDLGNPLQDLEGIFIHLSELLSDDVTDHIALGQQLANDPDTKPYMCYTIADA